MNDKIQYFVKEAIEHAKSLNRFGTDELHKGLFSAQDFQKKFAELIIKECANVAQDFVTVQNNQLVEKVHISPYQLKVAIEDHFGVE